MSAINTNALVSAQGRASSSVRVSSPLSVAAAGNSVHAVASTRIGSIGSRVPMATSTPAGKVADFIISSLNSSLTIQPLPLNQLKINYYLLGASKSDSILSIKDIQELEAHLKSYRAQ